MLQVEDLEVSYQSVAAVRGLSLSVPQGQIVGLVGANGAGKTSTLNAITGLVQRRGRTLLGGQDISQCKTADIVRRGLVQVAQGRQLFPDMSVAENLEMGGFLQSPASKREMTEKVFAQFPVLKERATQPAGTLSGGEQQMLAVARALMARPKVLLIDEPCLGLSPKMVSRLGEVIRQVNADGISILLVEQNTAFVFGLTSYAYVIENGRVVLEGTPDLLRRNDKVRSAYLGI
ncbi:High-affinity branched-chain amino acid transport ATP-binding protein LivF [Burkholderiales bacterium 8X]|nr:High-affinity branched-chain amino acid transport ATP-binding protein LivF [Burkholderiales bacterium 8X]